jgi:dipeptidyl aminopeptidase/acylaminoacyl peptidase
MSPARLLATAAVALLSFVSRAADPTGFNLEQILSAPFAADIVASPNGRALAWVSNARGRRNVWLAEARSGAGPFEVRALTHFGADDGLDVSELAFVPNRGELLYVLGGDAEYPDKPAANPAQIASGVEHEVFLVDFRGHAPVKLGTGHTPVAAPDGTRILFLQKGKVYSAPTRHGGKPELLFDTRGIVGSLRFSPDGHRLAFVCTRDDHSFVGLYAFADHALRWLDASLSFDIEPRWSPDGARIAFLRLPAMHDEVGIIAHRTGAPWSIRVASAADGRVAEIYRAPKGAGSVFHALSSEQQLYWSGNDSIVFPAENDGWLHFYSVPTSGGEARPLTPGGFEIEYATASSDGRRIVYAANAGDIDRRHLWQLEPASGQVEQLTNGGGIETQPAMLADGKTIALLSSSARTPAHVALLAPGQPTVDFMAEGLPPDFPAAALVVPQSVELPRREGISAHGILFVPAINGTERRPAVIFMHGGPVRQMLLGWHYMDYYSNAYAFNQYLASRGYVVLALNYRAGIGYGLDFREAKGIGADEASEYNDLLAASELLRSRADVDPGRIGLWGGSYGGYMTALGLGRNSDLFKAGVDMHGVHDWHHWTLSTVRGNRPLYPLDATPAVLGRALAASPLSAVATWRSPVLLIQGDDDHNVDFSETVRLAEALRERGVDYQELVMPDEIHDFLRHESWLKAYKATADFLDAKLGARQD